VLWAVSCFEIRKVSIETRSRSYAKFFGFVLHIVYNSSFVSENEASGKPFRSTGRGLCPATVKQKNGRSLNVYPNQPK